VTGRLLLAESGDDGLRAALVEDRRLGALEIDRPGAGLRVGAVLRAKVVRAAPGLGVVLRLPDGTESLLDGLRDTVRPQAGEILPVQIARAPHGQKLGTASRSVALAGRGLIHLPFESGIRASRRLAMDEEKRRLLDARMSHESGGWILRRAAKNLPEPELFAEIAALASEGAGLLRADGALPAPDAFRRLAADYGAPAPDRILVDGRQAEAAAETWVHAFAPAWDSRIERLSGPVVYPSRPSLFDQYDLDSAIDGLAQPRVALPGGGSLVIERTEALTAIDVNAGAEANLPAANCAAAAEIARQLRLRHIGGIVVIDFISMPRSRDRQRVMAALETALANDPARTHILPMSAFGLVEMTRERRGPGLEVQA
jgi:ribonuclease E/ribonuclease G